jgi:hypothetical protein
LNEIVVYLPVGRIKEGKMDGAAEGKQRLFLGREYFQRAQARTDRIAQKS